MLALVLESEWASVWVPRQLVWVSALRVWALVSARVWARGWCTKAARSFESEYRP